MVEEIKVISPGGKSSLPKRKRSLSNLKLLTMLTSSSTHSSKSDERAEVQTVVKAKSENWEVQPQRFDGGKEESRLAAVSMSELAKKGEFDTIAEILQESDLVALEKWLNQGGPDTTALHELLRYRPTVEVVDRMARTLTLFKKKSGSSKSSNDVKTTSSSMWIIAEEARDGQGRTPLHIAVAVGCDIAVIKRLLVAPDATMTSMSCNSFHNLAAVRDRQGRCPLHWASANPNGSLSTPFDKLSSPRLWRLGSPVQAMQLFRSYSFRSLQRNSPSLQKQQENMQQIMHYLITCYPPAVKLRDAEGHTPWDLALQAKANQATLSLLQSALGFLQHVHEQISSSTTTLTATGSRGTDHHLDFLGNDPMSMCLEVSTHRKSGSSPHHRHHHEDEDEGDHADDVSSLASGDSFRPMVPISTFPRRHSCLAAISCRN